MLGIVSAQIPLPIAPPRRTLRRRVLGVEPRCPDCGGPLVHGEGCATCPVCGYSECGATRSGLGPGPARVSPR